MKYKEKFEKNSKSAPAYFYKSAHVCCMHKKSGKIFSIIQSNSDIQKDYNKHPCIHHPAYEISDHQYSWSSLSVFSSSITPSSPSRSSEDNHDPEFGSYHFRTSFILLNRYALMCLIRYLLIYYWVIYMVGSKKTSSSLRRYF